MALEAILKVALVKSVKVRRRISIITRQTSPSTRENAWRGWQKLMTTKNEMETWKFKAEYGLSGEFPALNMSL